jgi:hypothetical protein
VSENEKRARQIVQDLVESGQLPDDEQTILQAVKDVQHITRQRVRYVVTRTLDRFLPAIR